MLVAGLWLSNPMNGLYQNGSLGQERKDIRSAALPTLFFSICRRARHTATVFDFSVQDTYFSSPSCSPRCDIGITNLAI